jgi:hypothetical protein
MGEFQNSPSITDRVCENCNREIGRAEEQFARSGPEAFFREVVGVTGRRSHNRVNVFERGSGGTVPIDFVGLHPRVGVPILWELNRGERTVREVRQIVVIPENGESVPIRIHPWMDGPELRDQVRELNLGTIKSIFTFASEEEAEWVDTLLSQLGEDVLWSSESEPVIVNQPTARLTVTEPYFRALAKIGFHYTLSTVSSITGHEPEFQDLRSFIRHGGIEDRFFSEVPGPLCTYPGIDVRPDRYCHLIVAEWGQGEIQARMQFFLGPDYEPSVYQIKLGSNISTLIDPGRIGHSFIYYPDGPTNRYAGESVPLILG